MGAPIPPSILAVAILLHSALANARFARDEDAPAHFDELKVSLRIKKDYSIERIDETVITLDQGTALKDMSIFEEIYTPATTQAKVLLAQTIHGATMENVSPRMIEDKPVASNAHGYDSNHSLKIAFPNLSVGSKIRVKLWRRTGPHPLPDFFSDLVSADAAYPVRRMIIRIESEVPFHHHLHDPFNRFKVTQSRLGRVTVLEATSQGIVTQHVTGEAATVFTQPQNPRPYISSVPDWDQIGTRIAAQYEQVIAAGLPPPFMEIAQRAKEVKDPLSRAEQVLSDLKKLVYYVGNWRTVRGQFFPRTLSEISTTKYGDCKDYAVAAVAILRKATVAWTDVQSQYRDASSVITPPFINFRPPLPGLYFNHAIALLTVEGKTYWIDPTSELPHVRTVRPELAGEYALVLHPKTPRLVTIPLPKAGDNDIEVKTFYSVNQDRTLDVLQRTRIKGYAATYTRHVLGSSKVRERSVEEIIADPSETRKDVKSPPPPADEFRIDSGRLGYDPDTKISAGTAITLPLPRALSGIFTDHSQRVGDLAVPMPGTTRQTTYILNGNLLGNIPMTCSINRGWLKVSRTFTQHGKVLEISEVVEIKEPIIPNQELKGVQFASLTEIVSNCLGETTLLFNGTPWIVTEGATLQNRPWALSRKQLLMTKLQRGIESFKRGYLEFITPKDESGRPAVPVTPIWSVAPDWSRGRGSEELIEKAGQINTENEGSPLAMAAAKFLMLEQVARDATRLDPLAAASFSTVIAGYSGGDDYESGAVRRARTLAETALAKDPLHPYANRALAKILLAEKKNDEALKQAEHAYRLEPSSTQGKKVYATALFKTAHYDEAIPLARESKYWWVLQEIYRKQGKPVDEEKAYVDSIQEAPTAWRLGNYGSFLIRLNRFDEAIVQLRRAIEARDYGMAHHNLARAYVGKGQKPLADPSKTNEAVELFRKALAEDNSYAPAHVAMGMAYRQFAKETGDSGHARKAQEYFEKALKIDPANQEAQAALLIKGTDGKSPGSGVAAVMQARMERISQRFRELSSLRPEDVPAKMKEMHQEMTAPPPH